MGRIKTRLVKRITNDLIKNYRQDLKNDFKDQKKFVSDHVTVTSKKVRNVIAGYATRLAKKRKDYGDFL
jgi:small subunit ribosomal protein S17e